MQFVSWNLNGIRSAEKQFLGFLKNRKPDVVMLQEIRAREDDLSLFLRSAGDYSTRFNDSGRSGYGGTAVYYKNAVPVEDIKTSTGIKILDDEGRTIVFSINNVLFINFYTPNGSSSQERFEYKLKFYEATKKYLKALLEQGNSIVVGGDLNVAHTDFDIHLSTKSLSHMRTGFLPEERRWFNDLLNLGFIDSFRKFEPGGSYYTWWHMRDSKRTLNRGIRFDYFLVSSDLIKKVTGAEILKNVFGSDHCPITLEIDI